MIKEWIQYLRSDAPQWARDRGLIYESIALQARHGRLKAHWDAHLQQTQDCICEFLCKNKFVKRVMVLGSGPLYDFPKSFAEEWGLSLTLVDAVHPEPVKRWAHRHDYVLRTADLALRSDKICAELSKDLHSVDAIVSLNLMSQLPLSISGDPQNVFQTCAEEHLQFLRMTGKPVLLISDFLQQQVDRTGKVSDSRSTIPSMPRPLKQWTWALAPMGEISKSFAIELLVGVWTDKQIRAWIASDFNTSTHEKLL